MIIKTKPCGIVYLAMLVFIQIFFMIGMACLEGISNTLKIENKKIQYKNILYALPSILKEIEHFVGQENVISCTIPNISTVDLVKKPYTWWEVHACKRQYDQHIYFFVVENLDVDPCAIINNHIAEYQRITLLLILNHDMNSRILEQTVITKPSNKTVDCLAVVHSVRPGRQMQREIF